MVTWNNPDNSLDNQTEIDAIRALLTLANSIPIEFKVQDNDRSKVETLVIDDTLTVQQKTDIETRYPELVGTEV